MSYHACRHIPSFTWSHKLCLWFRLQPNLKLIHGLPRCQGFRATMRLATETLSNKKPVVLHGPLFLVCTALLRTGTKASRVMRPNPQRDGRPGPQRGRVSYVAKLLCGYFRSIPSRFLSIILFFVRGVAVHTTQERPTETHTVRFPKPAFCGHNKPFYRKGVNGDQDYLPGSTMSSSATSVYQGTQRHPKQAFVTALYLISRHRQNSRQHAE